MCGALRRHYRFPFGRHDELGDPEVLPLVAGDGIVVHFGPSTSTPSGVHRCLKAHTGHWSSRTVPGHGGETQFMPPPVHCREDGKPTHVTLRRGLLFKHDTPLPADWIDAVGTDGLVLTVTKAEVDRRAVSDPGAERSARDPVEPGLESPTTTDPTTWRTPLFRWRRSRPPSQVSLIATPAR